MSFNKKQNKTPTASKEEWCFKNDIDFYRQISLATSKMNSSIQNFEIKIERDQTAFQSNFCSVARCCVIQDKAERKMWWRSISQILFFHHFSSCRQLILKHTLKMVLFQIKSISNVSQYHFQMRTVFIEVHQQCRRHLCKIPTTVEWVRYKSPSSTWNTLSRKCIALQSDLVMIRCSEYDYKVHTG